MSIYDRAKCSDRNKWLFQISELKKNEDQHRETTFDVVFKNSVISFQTDMNFVMATLQVGII